MTCRFFTDDLAISSSVKNLRGVLARIATHRVNRIAELLPWNIGTTTETRRIAA